jgi:hypothetical protein
MKTRGVVVALIALALALPSFGKTSKNTYPAICSELWGAVKGSKTSSAMRRTTTSRRVTTP